MAALKASGCDNNTLTIFTSDNGAPANHIAEQTDGKGSNSPLSGFKGATPLPAFARSGREGCCIFRRCL